MVIEHSFVTTLEAADALAAAQAFLVQRGFAPVSANPVAAGSHVVELKRGKTKTKQFTATLDFPQLVRIEWDRGRVTVAASITLPDRGSFGTTRKADTQPGPHSHLMVVVAQSLELLLAQQLAPQDAAAPLDQVERQLRAKASRGQLRLKVVVIALIVVLAIGMPLLIWLLSR